MTKRGIFSPGRGKQGETDQGLLKLLARSFDIIDRRLSKLIYRIFQLLYRKQPEVDQREEILNQSQVEEMALKSDADNKLFIFQRKQIKTSYVSINSLILHLLLSNILFST